MTMMWDLSLMVEEMLRTMPFQIWTSLTSLGHQQVQQGHRKRELVWQLRARKFGSGRGQIWSPGSCPPARCGLRTLRIAGTRSRCSLRWWAVTTSTWSPPIPTWRGRSWQSRRTGPSLPSRRERFASGWEYWCTWVLYPCRPLICIGTEVFATRLLQGWWPGTASGRSPQSSTSPTTIYSRSATPLATTDSSKSVSFWPTSTSSSGTWRPLKRYSTYLYSVLYSVLYCTVLYCIIFCIKMGALQPKRETKKQICTDSILLLLWQ